MPTPLLLLSKPKPLPLGFGLGPLCGRLFFISDRQIDSGFVNKDREKSKLFL